MSQSDSFIEEVTEEVRRDRLFALMRRYGWIAVALVVLIVGGAAYTEWQKAKALAESEAYGDALLSALDTTDPAARVAALEAIAKGDVAGTEPRRAVLSLIAADEALRGGDAAGARTRLETVANDTALPESLRQLAEIKALMIPDASVDTASRDAALERLATPGAPYRVLAMEQQALALVTAGKTDEALTLLRRILEEPDATQGLRRRVTQLIVALGGNPEAA